MRLEGPSLNRRIPYLWFYWGRDNVGYQMPPDWWAPSWYTTGVETGLSRHLEQMGQERDDRAPGSDKPVRAPDGDPGDQ